MKGIDPYSQTFFGPLFYPLISTQILINDLVFNNKEFSMANSVFDFSVKDINGQDVSLSQYKGKYLLVVNVASKCGFTPQYKGLGELFEELKDNVVVLGFPCNQFGKQEPGNAEEIKNFCSLTYDVKFPLFAKVDVNGDNAAPLYEFLK